MLLALKGPRTVERGEGDEKRGLSLRVGVRVGVEDDGVVGREGAGDGDGDGDGDGGLALRAPVPVGADRPRRRLPQLPPGCRAAHARLDYFPL